MTNPQPRNTLSFRLYSDDLAPEQLTALMRLEPDGSCRKGDAGEVGPYPAHGWFLRSDLHLPADEPLDAHLAWLADTLEPRLAELQQARDLGCETDVIGALHAGVGPYWLVLEPELLRRLAVLGLEIAVDIA